MSIIYDEIPSLDLEDFRRGEHCKKQFIQNLGRAYENIGFVTIYNHGLDKNLIEDLFRVVQNFFDLPENTKNKYEIPKFLGERGYVGKQKEIAKGFKVADLKEFFHVGQEIVSEKHMIYPQNIWPQEIENFREIALRSFYALEKIGKDILRAISLFLNLEEDFFEEKVHYGNSVLRAIHYFPLTTEINNSAVRAAEHCDINLITVLMSASAEGLQVKRHDGKWIEVKPDKDQLVINVGDMLSRLTNNLLKSTVHRVINPPQEKLQTSRYSIPFFMHPKPDIQLACLQSCISAEYPKIYEDVTAGQFLQQRLMENGLKV